MSSLLPVSAFRLWRNEITKWPTIWLQKADSFHSFYDLTAIDKMIASDADTAPDMARRRDWRRVLVPRVPDVQAIRRKLGMSQSEFATRFGFSVRTVQEWEQGRALPDRPARILLRVIEKSPKTVERAVAAG